MKTNTFFTIFWMLYFPLCIAFYQMLNFKWIDEILTAVMIVFAIAKGTFMQRKNASIMREVWIYLGIMAFYVAYSLVMAVNTERAVWLDLQQQVRPYAVLYCTWILNPVFTVRQKNWIIWMMVGCTLLYAFLWRTGMRGLTYSKNESAVIGQLSLVSGMVWYLWKPQTKQNAIISIVICAVGLIGGKSKFLGEMVAFVAVTYFLHDRIKLNSSKTILRLSLLAAVILFFTWTKFNVYYVEGMEDHDSDKRARPESYKTAMKIITEDYVPFGSGLGTFGTNAAAEYYSPLYYKYELNYIWGLYPENPMFLADAFYPTLAEYGLFGIFFFFLFWRRRLLQVLKLPDFRCYKMGLMAILALALEQTADTSYLSGKGMGYFMLLAICLNSARNFVPGKPLPLPQGSLRQQASTESLPHEEEQTV